MSIMYIFMRPVVDQSNRMECKVKTSDRRKKRSFESVCIQMTHNDISKLSPTNWLTNIKQPPHMLIATKSQVLQIEIWQNFLWKIFNWIERMGMKWNQEKNLKKNWNIYISIRFGLDCHDAFENEEFICLEWLNVVIVSQCKLIRHSLWILRFQPYEHTLNTDN